MGLLIAGAFAAVRVLASDPCLTYGPGVALTGKLEQRTYERETGYYLVLSKPVCTNPHVAQAPRWNVRLVQLVADEKGYKELRPHLGYLVRVRGALAGTDTGHHHAPLLLTYERTEAER